MNRKIKIAAISSIALLALAGGGFGAWYAWDNGKIGDNPRAPTPQAMEKAVRLQAAYLAMTTGARQPCLSLDLGSAQPEIVGIPGIGQQSVPGMHAATLLMHTNSRNQQVRDMQLAQFDYLAKQGLFSVADTTITTDDGVERPAKSYRLTWKGYASGRSNYGSSLCLNYGKREFAGIEKIEKTLEKMMDLDVYDVSYKTVVKGVPAWATTEDAKRHFPKLAELIGDGDGKAKVIRTHDGWRSAYELEAEISVAAKGGQYTQLAEMYRKQMQGRMDSATLSLDEAKDLVAKQIAEPEWTSRSGVACLPLNVQRGGDEKDAQGARDAAEFAITYYDRNDRKPYEYQTMARNLHIMAALEGAGLAEMEAIRPAPPPPPAKIGRKQPVQPIEPPKPLGIRYKVSKEAMTAMGMSGYGGGCIPAGRTKIEVLALQESYDYGQTSVQARATVDQTPEWALKIAEGLPALKTILENGLAMQGSLHRMPEGSAEAGKWKLSGLTPIYPTLSYDSIPAHLKPVMPLTVAAYPGKTVKAPALVPELRASAPAPILRVEPAGAAGAPAAPPAPPAGIDDAPAPSYRPAPPPAPMPMPKKTSSGPIYPADGSPVHVVSIYEAPMPGGAKRGFQQHPEGSVSVTVSTNNATLLLFSYEPVEWKINAGKDVKLKRVVATGYYDQRIVFLGGGKPEVSAVKIGTLADQSGIDLRSMSVPRKADANGMTAMAALTQALTGALPASFQTAYTAPEAGFAIDDRTPKFALPALRAPGATPVTVTLQGSWGEKFIKGYTVQRGSAGAYNEYWTDRVYSGGKAYFEGKLRVTGSLTAHGYANIGLCLATEKGVDMSARREVLALADDEQKLYKDGDVFGVAADFDDQLLYFRVNGKWITGEPGSKNGKRLRKGTEYRACVLTSGTTSGDVERGGRQSDSTWEVNFGTKPFAHPVPAGYRPFQGGQA